MKKLQLYIYIYEFRHSIYTFLINLFFIDKKTKTT